MDNMFNDLILLATWAVRLHCFIVSHRFTILSLSVGLLLYRWLLPSSSSSSPTATYYSSLPTSYASFVRDVYEVHHHRHHVMIGAPSLRPVFYGFDNGALSVSRASFAASLIISINYPSTMSVDDHDEYCMETVLLPLLLLQTPRTSRRGP